MTLLAFALRLAATYALGGLDRPFYGDENSYVPLAIALSEGRGFVNDDGTPHFGRMPGIPFLISLLFRIAGPSVPAARVLMCALSSLLVPFCYLLGQSIGDRRCGLLAAVAATLLPSWLYFSGSVLTDLPAAVFTTAAAWLLAEGQTKNRLTALAGGGLLIGLGILVRPTSLVFVPAVVLWLCFPLPGWRRRLRGVVVVCGAIACAIGPWSVRNSLALGRMAGPTTAGGASLWIGNNPNATGILGDDYGYYREHGIHLFPKEKFPDAASVEKAYKAEALKFIKENPGRFLQLCAIRLWEFWKVFSPRVPWIQSLALASTFGVALPFFCIQLVRRGWRPGPDLLLVLIIASQTAVHVVFVAIIRYRMPIEPLVIVMAASGFFWTLDRIRERQTDP